MVDGRRNLNIEGPEVEEVLDPLAVAAYILVEVQLIDVGRGEGEGVGSSVVLGSALGSGVRVLGQEPGSQ